MPTCTRITNYNHCHGPMPITIKLPITLLVTAIGALFILVQIILRTDLLAYKNNTALSPSSCLYLVRIIFQVSFLFIIAYHMLYSICPQYYGSINYTSYLPIYIELLPHLYFLGAATFTYYKDLPRSQCLL